MVAVLGVPGKIIIAFGQPRLSTWDVLATGQTIYTTMYGPLCTAREKPRHRKRTAD